MATRAKAPERRELRIEYLPLDAIRPDPENPKDHDLGALSESFERFGFIAPLVLNEKTGLLLAGHGRLEDLKTWRSEGRDPPPGVQISEDVVGGWSIPVVRGVSLNPKDGKAYVVADNRIVELGGWNEPSLIRRLIELAGTDASVGLKATGFSAEDVQRLLELSGGGPAPIVAADPSKAPIPGALLARFGIPPFSVLDARKGYWRKRKLDWLSLGIRSAISRPMISGKGPRAGSVQATIPSYYYDRAHGKSHDQIVAAWLKSGGALSTTSIFDPVLSELVYRWFSPAGAYVLDPFAGGSVRGIVAAVLGRRYVGIELREEQVEANREQAQKILSGRDLPLPVWIVADAKDLSSAIEPGQFDLVFTCPPYFDLELYSDDPRDLANAETYALFLARLDTILRSCASVLKPDRYLALVLGDLRDEKGNYRTLPADVVAGVERSGLSLYNDAVVVGETGSVPMKVSRYFPLSRKLGRIHQSLVVFRNGDPNGIGPLADTEFGELLPEDGDLLSTPLEPPIPA